MQSKARSVEEYLDTLPEDRKEPMTRLRSVIVKNLPKGFAEEMTYGMIGYVVPHEIYPPGYHCNPKQPLPFINIASQKQFIALYHMGIYADKKLMEWFRAEYGKLKTAKLDMGKSCIRFKKTDQIPLTLIGTLVKKLSTGQWIALYESVIKQ